MPLLLHTSSFKTTATVVIASALSVATALILTVPSVLHFVLCCFPIIYDNTVFLLKPPYLYLVINFIIFSIVATSKLTHKPSSNDDSEISEVVTPVQVQVPSAIDTSYLNLVHLASDHTGYVEKNDVKDDATVKVIQKVPEVIAHGEEQQPETEKPKQSSNSLEIETEMPIPKNDSSEVSIMKSSRKPPRFNQQKSIKTNPEGVYKKTALGVSKPPRREDTLETTWKKITEGRSTPLTKHLTKSDTWQERGHVQSSSEKQKKKAKVTKSDNLNGRNVPLKKTRLKREPSPGQEELNQRVEAFINKFNEEMRLQRLESLAKYNEMVSGGTRL